MQQSPSFTKASQYSATQVEQNREAYRQDGRVRLGPTLQDRGCGCRPHYARALDSRIKPPEPLRLPQAVRASSPRRRQSLLKKFPLLICAETAAALLPCCERRSRAAALSFALRPRFAPATSWKKSLSAGSRWMSERCGSWCPCCPRMRCEARPVASPLVDLVTHIFSFAVHQGKTKRSTPLSLPVVQLDPAARMPATLR